MEPEIVQRQLHQNVIGIERRESTDSVLEVDCGQERRARPRSFAEFVGVAVTKSINCSTAGA